MKYALIIPDGVADEPQSFLGGKTPLEAAHVPNMDEIARLGVVGRADNVPASLPSGSDVATMSLFGYDPLVFHTGRAPIEAAAQGIPLGPDDWCIRCNFVTVVDGVMKSFTAGQIPNDLAHLLISQLNARFGGKSLEFFAGVSYRNLLVWRPDLKAEGGRQKAEDVATTISLSTVHRPPSTFSQLSTLDSRLVTTPPHDITDRPVEPHLPQGSGSEALRNLMLGSVDVLAGCAENRARAERGELTATQIWLWGQGKRPALEPFQTRFGITGAMITAVDLLRGMAVLLGWKVINVPGATGYLDTDYAAKGAAAIRALDDVDFVVVHVEATDEASHEGHVDAKVTAVEAIDRDIVGPVHRHLQQRGQPYRILVSPDHPTFLRTKTHSHGFVPFTICGTGISPGGSQTYDETTAAQSSLCFPKGHELMRFFVK
ncbi:MAG: phosphoglycerate mutase [Planctomycetales bacterium]|nr:phosphoglycerate mutase [Planctomycetales bacterium]